MLKINETLENLRESYQGLKLDIENCSKDPEVQFDLWLEHAIQAKCPEPNAFILSTVDKDNKPHARVVLLKGVHEGKFIFYTNYESSKGYEINSNSNVALTFVWLPLARQIRIEGTISKADGKVSDEYFHKRPKGSQIGAIASPQSNKLSSRAELEKLFKDAEDKFGKLESIPRPAHWGGYEITPSYYEFWQGRNNRLHDRIAYEKNVQSWDMFRLAP